MPDPSIPIDFEAGVSDHVRSTAARVEDEIFIGHLLGLQIPREIPDAQVDQVAFNMAQQVAIRIAGNVDVTRHAIDQAQLGVLNQNISAALRRVIPGTPGRIGVVADTAYHQRVRAIAEAVRESLSKQGLLDYVQYGLPAVIHQSENIPAHHVNIRCDINGAPRHLQIDLRHTFWRNQVIGNIADLQKELTGKPLSSLGIRDLGSPPMPETYIIQNTGTNMDAENMTQAETDVIDLDKSYTNIDSTITVGGQTIQVSINTANLIKHRMQTAPFRGELVASLSRAQLNRALQQHAELWNFITTDPLVGPGTPNASFEVAELLWGRLQGNASIAPTLALSKQTLLKLHQEISEQHRFFTRLRHGSDNYSGAAVAATILMRYKDLRNVLSGRDAAIIQAEIDVLQNQIYVHEELKKLAALPVKLSTASVNTYQDAIDEDAHLRTDRSIVTTVGAAWSSQYMSGYPAVPPLAGATANNAISSIQAAITENKTIVREYEVIERQLVLLKQRCDLAGVSSPRLTTFFTPGPGLNKLTLDKNFDPAIVANEIESQLKTGGTKLLSRTDIDTQIKTKEEEKTKTGKEGLSGDTAQHEVIKEYLRKYHGSTEHEANAATNYIRARSYVDAELSSAAEELSGELYGENVSRGERTRNWFSNLRNLSKSPEARSEKILAAVARSCGVSMTGDVPQWRATKSPGAVITAYFSLKKLHEGSAGSKAVRLQKTDAFLLAMREISKALVTEHVVAFVRDLGPGVGVDASKQAAIIKEPTKSEHVALLRQMLEGSAPTKYDKGIERAIQVADRGVEWVRRRFVLGEVGGEKTKISAGGLLRGGKAIGKYGIVKPIVWGRKKLGAVGKAVIVNPIVGTAKFSGRAIAAPFQFIKKNPGTTAAAIGAVWLLGPVGLLAAGAYHLSKSSGHKAA